MAKVGSNYTCLALILIDFVFKKDKYYCLQVLLKECEYIEKEKSDYTYYWWLKFVFWWFWWVWWRVD